MFEDYELVTKEYPYVNKAGKTKVITRTYLRKHKVSDDEKQAHINELLDYCKSVENTKHKTPTAILREFNRITGYKITMRDAFTILRDYNAGLHDNKKQQRYKNYQLIRKIMEDEIYTGNYTNDDLDNLAMKIKQVAAITHKQSYTTEFIKNCVKIALGLQEIEDFKADITENIEESDDEII